MPAMSITSNQQAQEQIPKEKKATLDKNAPARSTAIYDFPIALHQRPASYHVANIQCCVHPNDLFETPGVLNMFFGINLALSQAPCVMMHAGHAEDSDETVNGAPTNELITNAAPLAISISAKQHPGCY